MRRLQEIACGTTPTPRKNARRLRYDEMVLWAREMCDELGLSYDFQDVYGQTRRADYIPRTRIQNTKRRNEARQRILIELDRLPT